MDTDKYTRVRAVVRILSDWKELETSKGVKFCNVLACPMVGAALRLHFFNYTPAELRVLLDSPLGAGEQIEIIGIQRGVFDEKPDVTVRYVRAMDGDSWLQLM